MRSSSEAMASLTHQANLPYWCGKMKTCDIRIRDPFVFPEPRERVYYMFGTTAFGETELGFDCYKSSDLREWDGPIPAFRPSASFWATSCFWAPEVHRFKDRYYMFASFKAERRYRATQILTADNVSGPYAALTGEPSTPHDWECLDGTLHVDLEGNPWIVFCHEWTQVHNGGMYAMRLAEDLKQPAGRPVFLFRASEGPWVKRHEPGEGGQYKFPTYVTDGPFLHRLASGVLLLLWSSFGPQGYAIGTLRSETGHVTGPWRHDPEPLWENNGGHGMIFQTFDDRLVLAFHCPNKAPEERPTFIEIEETDDGIRLAKGMGREL
jgi:arabinan endo-1,5-alpha-L-arabinosidase